MNPYALRRKHLKLVRLPISPPPLEGQPSKYTKGAVAGEGWRFERRWARFAKSWNALAGGPCRLGCYPAVGAEEIAILPYNFCKIVNRKEKSVKNCNFADVKLAVAQ